MCRRLTVFRHFHFLAPLHDTILRLAGAILHATNGLCALLLVLNYPAFGFFPAEAQDAIGRNHLFELFVDFKLVVIIQVLKMASHHSLYMVLVLFLFLLLNPPLFLSVHLFFAFYSGVLLLLPPLCLLLLYICRTFELLLMKLIKHLHVSVSVFLEGFDVL